MKRSGLFATIGVLTLLAGCHHNEPPASVSPPPAPPPSNTTTAAPPPADTGLKLTPAGYTRDPDDPFQAAAYAEPDFTPQVADYSVAPDFSNVGNWNRFASVFDAEQQQKLAQNLFLVLPADRHQMSFIYEENNYTAGAKDPEIPTFVTTDSVLHTFHVFYDFLLRNVENTGLYDDAGKMTRKLLEGTQEQYAQESSPEIKQAALKNIAYLLVPAKALQLDTQGLTIPDEAQKLADAEWTQIQAHNGPAASPIFGYTLDYSQFEPRGHYTRSERLKAYFVAMMWYGNVPIMVRDKDGQAHPEQVRQAALLGALLTANTSDPSAAGSLWRQIYEPTAFMVGIADDLTPIRFQKSVAGAAQSQSLSTALMDNAILDKIVADADQNNPAKIVNGLRTKEIAVKLMGQRFVVDSYIFQQLIFPSVGTQDKARLYPAGLDVLSAFGNDRAFDILKTDYKQADFANYETQMKAVRDYIQGVTPDQWQQNIYWGWLDVLRRVVEPKGKGYPSLMQTAAWQDKSLNTALGSWAELRHDTILYAKQAVAECGEGGSDETDRPPRGYVEPDVRTYHRLDFLLLQLRDGLKKRGYLDSAMETQCQQFDDLLKFLVDVSKMELTNQPLNREEEETLHNYGDTMTRLNMFTHEVKTTKNGENWSEITSETDKDMAVAADVFSNNQDQKVLQANVGHANEIYAVFPARGKLWIGRGAVFSYYEFLQPMSDRLTDEKWQEMLSGPKPPSMPDWIKSFFHEKGRRLKRKVDDRALEDTRSTGGC